MLPHRRAPAAAAPLLSFPPSSPPLPFRSSASPLPPIDHSPSFSLLSTASQLQDQQSVDHIRRKKRSLCYRVLAAVPLGFIYALLLFSFYTVPYSLAFDYLLASKGETLRAVAIWVSYGWLLYGCGGSLWMCYYKHEGNFVRVGGDEREGDDARDEEERVHGSVPQAGEEAAEDEDEGTEHQGLLDGDDSSSSGYKRSRRTGQPIQVKSDGTKRFCRKCHILKPDRAHHCSTCQRCVLKMDHHCPWLGGGCAGYANYKFFLQFLLYTGALGVYIAGVCFYSLVNYTSNEPAGYEMAPISWALAALLGIIFGSATGLFGLYHLYLAANNRTTIEAMESPTTFSSTLPPAHLIAMIASQMERRPESQLVTATAPRYTRAQLIQQLHARLSPKQKLRLNRAKRRHNVYDLGWKGNLKELFTSRGDEEARRKMGHTEERNFAEHGRGLGKSRWWEWIVPWGEPAGDGYTFPINLDNLRKLEEISKEIWAEVEVQEREHSSYGERGSGRWETGLMREGTLPGEGDSDRLSVDEDDRPLRRA